MNRSPVIIIGAPRSGTNMLRDVLCKIDGFDTWPCDEINYIWRHGNRELSHDAFPVELATPDTVAYLRERFEVIRSRRRCRRVVEKTCANSLRVPFVDRAFPDARYLFIVRDGLDVVASARERRGAGLAPAYLYAKARYVPFEDLPYYGWRYALERLDRLRGKERVVSRWGPAPVAPLPAGVESTALTDSAHQWAECVTSSEQAFGDIDPARVHRLSYEGFVRDPVEQTRGILTFLDEPSPSGLEGQMGRISGSSVGKGRASLRADELAQLEPLVQGAMNKFGYVWPKH